MVDSLPLPSWNDSAAKSAILDFVARVTKQGGTEFVPPAARIATFDNDGTLWCEQPLQTQFFFAFDRVKQLSGKDPTMSERQPFKAVLEHDYNTSSSRLHPQAPARWFVALSSIPPRQFLPAQTC